MGFNTVKALKVCCFLRSVHSWVKVYFEPLSLHSTSTGWKRDGDNTQFRSMSMQKNFHYDMNTASFMARFFLTKSVLYFFASKYLLYIVSAILLS